MKKFVLVGLMILVLSVSLVVAIPDEQCYKLAKNKDNVLENIGGALQWTGNNINPCTGLKDSVSTYYDLDGGITQIRTVYGNGDVYGYLGLTRYTVCQDGRAKVSQRIYGPGSAQGYGIAWGFWYNFPFDDDPLTWVKDKEVCNTL